MATDKNTNTTTIQMESLNVPDGDMKKDSKRRGEKMEKKYSSDHSSFDGPTSKVPFNSSSCCNHNRNTIINEQTRNNNCRSKQFVGRSREVNPPRFLPLSNMNHPMSTSRHLHYHQGINYVSNYPGLNYLSKHKPVTKQRSVQSTTHTIGSQSSREGLLLLSSGDELDEDLASPCPPPPFPFSNSDGTDVRQMEQGLLQLLDDFHLGKLQAFGKDITFEKMEQVREKQERLAKLHFELMASSNGENGLGDSDSPESRLKNRDSMNKLMGNLQELSSAIEQLQSKSGTNAK